MDTFVNFMICWQIVCVLEIASAVFVMLFMYNSAKHRNHTLSVGWYICGFLFGIWTFIIFLIKRKDFPGPEIKKCVQCGYNYPAQTEECQNCHILLPQIDAKEKKKQAKLSKIFFAATVISYMAVLTVGIIAGVSMGKYLIDNTGDYLTGNRISVNGVYYDKKGNSYEDENDVLLYDEEGHVYTYIGEEVTDDDFYSFIEFYYVREDGKKYLNYDCYVTEDGWLYCDKAGILEFYSIDTSTMSEEELDIYYENLLEDENIEYRYYDYPYTDADGNLYFSAVEASWNEKGELITAENDIYAN